MNIYDPISASLNLPTLSEEDASFIYSPLEKTNSKSHSSPNLGKTFDDEWRKNIGISLKGRDSPMKGKKLPDDHPFKKGTGKGRVWTEEQKQKVRDKLSNRVVSLETRRKISNARKGLISPP